MKMARLSAAKTGGHLNTFGDKGGPVASVAFGPQPTRAGGGWLLPARSGPASETVEQLPRWSPLTVCGLQWVWATIAHNNGGVLIWDPQKPASSGTRDSAALVVEPLSRFSYGSLLIVDWSGQSQVFETATGELRPGLKVQKTLVSAANWSPIAPVMPWQVPDWAQGIAQSRAAGPAPPLLGQCRPKS